MPRPSPPQDHCPEAVQSHQVEKLRMRDGRRMGTFLVDFFSSLIFLHANTISCAAICHSHGRTILKLHGTSAGGRGHASRMR